MSKENFTWYITNMGQFKKDNGEDSFFTNVTAAPISGDKDKRLFIDGYIIPRLSVYSEYKNIDQHDLVGILYLKYGLNFIQYIKGVFTIIFFTGNKLYIFNDRHGLQKYFIYQSSNKFIISNSMKFISENVNLTFSKENAATFCLLDHFMDGSTMFEEVMVNKPASILIFKDDIKLYTYWQPQELFNHTFREQNFEILAETWKKLTSCYIEYLKPSQISLTLTGGNDSRMILAGLLANDVKPNTFTFGNPASSDGVIAKQIANKLNIPHNIYYVKSPSNKWFADYANKIISCGNSLVNIHRAHRMDAIEQEKIKNSKTDMLFTGLVGGEYIKEPAYNNIVIPLLFKWFVKNKNPKSIMEEIKSSLINIGFNMLNVDISMIYEKIKSISEYGEGINEKQKKFVYTYHYYAAAHHFQDSKIFAGYVDYVVNPFMDVEFLELLSSYPGWYIHKNATLVDKIWSSYFLIKITDILAPELSDIPYAKKGEYTGNDLLGNPFLYLLKRGLYFIQHVQNKYPRNFPMGQWLYDFCKHQLIEMHPQIVELLDINVLKNKLETIKEELSEEIWHVITNPINLSMNLKYYAKI